MRRKLWLIIAIITVAAGCHDKQARYDHQEKDSELNTWMVDSYHDEAVRNAIIRQRTVFAHYFDPATAKLNELGEHDVGVLAKHLQQSPGSLSVRRGDADEQLYQKRVDAVLAALTRGGVDRKLIQVTEDNPIGDRASGNRVLVLIEKANQPSDITDVSDGGRINTFTTTRNQ